MLDDAGRPVGAIGISSDVSARESARADLEQAQRTTAEALTLLSTLEAEAPVGFAFIDRDLRFVRINRELAATVGLPIDVVVGRTVRDVMPPPLWDQLAPVYRNVLSTGDAVRNQPVREEPGDGGPLRERTTSHYPVRVGEEIIGTAWSSTTSPSGSERRGSARR